VKPHRHGLVLGKFYPPHRGHHFLVRQAAAGCERTTVLVMASSWESIGLAERVAWMREVHAEDPGVTVLGVPDDAPVDYGDHAVWDAHVALVEETLTVHGRGPVDAVYSSEPYGEELARRLGARAVTVDPERLRHPVSGTACRADLAARWDDLHPVVRAGLAARVVVVGAESTGTTTISRWLAEHFRARGGVWARTAWVPEYGREYTALKWDRARATARAEGRPEPALEDLVWTAEDFARIAAEQTRQEEKAAREGSPLVVCDTDAFATAVWEHRYTGRTSAETLAWAGERLPRRDVYLLTDHTGVPFVQDGLRDGEHVRADMTGWFRRRLTEAGHSWVLLRGDLEERCALAARTCELVLARRLRLGEPLPQSGDVATLTPRG